MVTKTKPVITIDPDACKFLKLYEQFTKKHWGSRCKDFEADCPCCEAWRRYDIEYEQHVWVE